MIGIRETFMRSGKHSCVALAMLLSAVLADAAGMQAKPRVTVQLGSGVARLGQEVGLQVVVEDARSARIVSVPSVEGLSLGAPRGPAREQGMRVEGGRTARWNRLTWTIPVRPGAVGDYEIPPLEVEVDGDVIRSRSLTLRVVRDLSGADLGFLEITPSPSRVVEGQPFSLEIRFGWEAETSVNLADLLLPWWGELAGAVELADRDLDQSAQRVEGVTVNSREPVVVEEIEPQSRAGRKYRTFRLVKSFIPGRPGTLEFPKSFLEFGQMIRGRSLFENPRKKTYFVQAPPLSLDVVALPTEGQPYDFSGAVGTLEARATADTRDLVEGDSIKLEIVWSGKGNLEFFDPPDPALLDSFRGFRVYGRTEEKSFDQRKVTYDLAPLSAEVDEIPSIPLSVFDPVKEAYDVVTTDPIPIRVRPLEGRVGLEADDGPHFVRDVRDIDTTPLSRGADPGDGGPPDRALVVLAFAVPTCWLFLRGVVRRRRGDPDAPLERRRRRARKELVRGLARASGPEDKLLAFTAFLAARAKEPEGAWVGRDARRWLEGRADAEHGAGEGVAAVVSRLEAAVYGAGAGEVSDEEILSAAERWQRATGGGRAA